MQDNLVMFTIDVETDWCGKETRAVVEILPRLIRLMQKYAVTGTFFVMANLVSLVRDVIAPNGPYEVGSHGLTHKPLKKMRSGTPHAKYSDHTPWGAAQHAVSEEVLAPFEGDKVTRDLFKQMLNNMGMNEFEGEITKAVLFGLEIASHSDDYGKVGIEYEDEAKVNELLKRIDMQLTNSEVYSQYQFYSHSIITLQDMLDQELTIENKKTLRNALQNYTEKLKELETKLRREFKGLNREELGGHRDREEYYYKMGVSNFLRGKDIVPALDQLYRVYGVNYQVEDGFRAITRELPVFQNLLTRGLEAIGEWSLLELQQYIRSNIPDQRKIDKK